MLSQDSHALFEEFFRSPLEIHLISNPDGQVEYSNTKWTEILGWSVDEVIGQRLIEFVHPEDRAQTSDCVKRLRSSGDFIAFENRFKAKDGHYRWFRWNSRCRDGNVFISGHDITDLKIKGLFLKDIESNARVLGWRLVVESEQIFWSSEATANFSFELPDSLNGLKSLNFLNLENGQYLLQAINGLIRGEPCFEMDTVVRSSNGEPIWLRFRGSSVRELGQTVAISGTVQDVTAMRAISGEVLHQKSRLERLMRNSPGMVYLLRLAPDGKVTMDYASPKAFEIYEVTEEEFLKNPSLLHETIHPEDVDSIMEATLLSQKNLTPFDWTGRLLTRSGKVKWINARSIPENQEDGSTLWDGIVIDVTQKIEREKELAEQALISQHQSRLASIGLLAAGVGHEINNPLAVVLGKVWAMEQELVKPEPDLKVIAAALEKQKIAVRRIQKIVDGLRTFTRMDKLGESTCFANEITEQVLMMMQEIFAKEQVKIEFFGLEEDRLLCCGAGQFQQVLMNLISNARDATEGRPDRLIHIELRQVASERVEVIVSDNGCGMDLAIADRIFEPFFTTKETGRGTGLGLGISKSLAQAWGGDLNLVSSQPGRGTTFKFFVPIKAKEIAKMDSAEEVPLNSERAALEIESPKLLH